MIVAIRLDGTHAADPSWFDGPPYAVAETVFDEHDLASCSRDPAPVDAPADLPPR